jgi:hypothetical protein
VCSGRRRVCLTARTAGGVVAIHWPVPLRVSRVRCLLAILRLVCWLVLLLVRHLCSRCASQLGAEAAFADVQLCQPL